ncbi:MAG: HAD-IIIA family hydrolase [Candidatus Omnitrophica bacterium]|nr:HAD-IIIA family hydrolase [Candidatus Omnitrophota bacterium]
MLKKFVFIDRDGVINRDPGGWTKRGYVTRWDEFDVLPGVLEAMRMLAEAGYGAVIVSNQQGVGKGYMTKRDLLAVSEKMSEVIRASGGTIDGIYYCTHLKEENCSCRKPKSGLFVQAEKDLDIGDISGMFYIGDTERDIQAGRAAGMRTILVLSGKSVRGDIDAWKYKPDHICADLLAAVKFILNDSKIAGGTHGTE